jgi:hypothetical protein
MPSSRGLCSRNWVSASLHHSAAVLANVLVLRVFALSELHCKRVRASINGVMLMSRANPTVTVLVSIMLALAPSNSKKCCTVLLVDPRELEQAVAIVVVGS